ncbi:hypothetical protein [Natrinema gelatinilyticum]|uniref:hypothetical protein n=1 Tax=Natrinema gelatinilyticum TaxID=2961571 RepID=UPI0020C4C20C|nr:hypothetical protein [Natrinema gelatinilyticum]
MSQHGAIPKNPADWPSTKDEDEWSSFCDLQTMGDRSHEFERRPVEDLLDDGYTPCSQCFPKLNDKHGS